MHLVGVAAEHVDTAWPLVEHWVRRATDQSPHFSPEDIREACKTRDMSLWALVDGDEVVGAVVTEIAVWPQCKVARAVLASANDGLRDEWLPLLRTLEEWGRAYGCDQMEIYGRPGWERLIPGGKRRTLIEWSLR